MPWVHSAHSLLPLRMQGIQGANGHHTKVLTSTPARAGHPQYDRDRAAGAAFYPCACRASFKGAISRAHRRLLPLRMQGNRAQTD